MRTTTSHSEFLTHQTKMAATPVVPLGKDRHLVGLRRDIRGRSGYVITDTVADTIVLCTQKLKYAEQYINRQTEDRVNVASLYEGPKLSRLVHRRWRVERYTLEEAASAFETRRAEHPNARPIVLCMPHRMTVT